ncbi:MAG: hypothetical protein OSA93_07455 [Akkermansiaceae bacterium]|nr:hypothetical protein [Akkermansiaceae bacterium]
MKIFLTALAIIALVAVAGIRIMSLGGLMGFKYESTVVVQVHYTVFALPSSKGSTHGTLMTRNYMVNEFETITSNATLNSAIEAIALAQRWDLSLEETLEKVKTMVSAEPRRGTDFIEIKARSHNQEDAHDIVNAVVDSYIARRNKMEMARAKKAIEALDKELQEQGDLVNDKRKNLTPLIQSYGIPYFDPHDSTQNEATEEKMHLNAQQRLDQLEQDRDRLKIQIDQLIKTSAEEMIPTVAALELPENQVSILYTQYLETLRESEKLAAQGLAEDHPSQVALTTQANELMGNAKKAVISLKETLNTRLNLVGRQVERMKETILNKKEISLERAMRQHEYNSAKEEYEQSRDLLREMKLHQAEQRALLKMPRQAVTRHE